MKIMMVIMLIQLRESEKDAIVPVLLVLDLLIVNVSLVL